ncbi:drug/metabolite transporter (DMT)-like permease [Pelomonas aquatica]|uniref:Drug/metabolite transporter (DMT)-like permease n=1 Tax=Pelomonas aquatica TaxID=431058 RepID=A0ABU1ZDP3_9BURK|nr:DMT family transporter [Pelomonas aquatica]MDR7298745.1 drug/metabolite transporter (DMT)-like permease [Pelomonas aquatica]
MNLLDRIAPPLFIFIWATGYLVAKLAAPYADPLTFLSWRYAGVVALMLGLALAARAAWPSRRDMLHLAVAGIGIQALYLAGVWVSIRQGLPAGTAALIVNLQPVLVAALAPMVGERVTPRQWLGVGFGLAGVVLVIWHKLTLGASFGLPLLLCLMALLGITAGTLYQKRFVPHFDLRTGQVVQFAASLAVTLPLAWWLEPMRIEWNASVLVAMAWSILVLTAGGISLMFYMLRHGRVTAVSSTMYLVPSVTSVMAWLMFGETLGAQAIAGMGVTLLGVYLVVGQRTPETAS